MSIFSARLSVQLPAKWALPAQDCALCLAPAGRDLVCAACTAQLPRPGPSCARCALPLAFGEVCGACLLRPPAFDAAAAAFEYRFPVDRMVARFKHGGDFAVGAWLARALARCCAQRARPALLVAPPLTPRRLRERGFDQAAQLARGVGGELGIAHAPGALRRVRDTAAQKGLGARERRANLRDAFRCTRPLHGIRVAIVDDVLTTGATAEAVAAALRAAGAGAIEVWAVARTPRPGD